MELLENAQEDVGNHTTRQELETPEMGAEEDFLPTILPVFRQHQNQTVPDQNGMNRNAVMARPPPESIAMQNTGPSTNQLISSSQAVLRGAFAGASFQGPVTINFNMQNHSE